MDRASVFKSDIKGYYASIDHRLLMPMLEPKVRDPGMLELLGRWLGHVIDDGGVYTRVIHGISLEGVRALTTDGDCVLGTVR